MSYLRRHHTSAAAVLGKFHQSRAIREDASPLCTALLKLQASCLGHEELRSACDLVLGVIEALLSHRDERKYRCLVVGDVMNDRLLRHGPAAIEVLRLIGFQAGRRAGQDIFECAEPNIALLTASATQVRLTLSRVNEVEEKQLRGAAELGRSLFAHSLRKNRGVAWAV